ncbi:RNA-directed RNA polymerase [ssRNA phage Esthiorhiza.2_6]|uniref:RNA-directed RNA polymerase n=2 Tax=Fiersviridae TaxID=2842319 RepID=A0A8S5L3I3_9VIRU|nr:RNA-directed RNA polymerase [ssRNA phage Esthiorhiza.2_6]QDH90506.1 MAG: RNA-dependent RNA polymerase [Leviviridae sp.]DAD51943.1 TPA_asm: RNA-directed RNA polymerase [ssRNA phage Esthiorhiza.2_6]
MHSEKQGKKSLIREISTFRVPEATTYSVVHEYFKSLDCPRSLTCWLLYESGEYDQLVNLDISPKDFNDSSSFRDAYQATKFLSKNSFLKVNIDRKAVALSKFSEMEELCKETNRRFRNPSLDQLSNWDSVTLLNAMRQKITSILGVCPIEEVLERSNWGPGVSTLLKGSNVSATNKFQQEVGITRDLYSLMFDSESSDRTGIFELAYPLWGAELRKRDSFPVFEVGNVVVTVPKNSKTDRVIAVEPGLNLWFQLGIGKVIRRKLRRHGIDLSYQSRNQWLAKLGSESPFFATVDFSSASDSISKSLVRELLPPDWFFLLDTCRSHFGTLEGKTFLHEKFSSMGNGFTFELESLIFFAAAACVCESMGYNSSMVSVYGDDVILPSPCFELFSSFSRYLGFIVNVGKSYADGYFRESCGAYWFDGVDVKPIFLREMVRTPLQVYRLANAIRRQARTRNVSYGCDARLRKCWNLLVNCLPKPMRLKIDDSLGDGGFISNFDEATPSRARDLLEGYSCRHVTEVGLTSSSEEVGLLLDRLRSASSNGSAVLATTLGDRIRLRDLPSSVVKGNFYSLRGKVKLRLHARSLVSQWTDLGPWL